MAWLKFLVRRLLPHSSRQFVSGAMRRLLGPRWKRIGFAHIDNTPLSALSKKKLFEPELKLLPLFLSGPGVVFDVGANMGEYTYVLEKTVSAERVYAIEPVSQLVSNLKNLFPQAHVLRVALSDAEGTLSLKIPIVDNVPLRTRSTLEGFVEAGETGSITEVVPVLPLDQLCKQQGISQVQLIKIDVEGHEQKALLGALQTIRSCHPILLVEIEQRHHEQPISEIFSWVKAQGYAGFFYDPAAMSLRSIEAFSVTAQQLQKDPGAIGYINNFLFLPESTAESRVATVNESIKQGRV